MRVFIVDDDPIVAESLALILGAQPDIDVVGVGSSAEDAVAGYAAHSPDILLTDIQMPGGSGLDAAREVLTSDPAARVVFLTTFADDEYVVAALRMGAKGYLIKQEVATIAPALRSVMAGQSVLGSEVTGRLDALVSRPAPEADPKGTALRGPGRNPASRTVPGALAGLTEREVEIVELIAQGMDNRQIAGTVYISEGTVRNHISAILAKLNLKNRTQLAIAYYQG